MNVEEKGLFAPFRAPIRSNGLLPARSVAQSDRSRDQVVAAVALALIAFLDYVTDVQLRVGLFYLVPVVFVA